MEKQKQPAPPSQQPHATTANNLKLLLMKCAIASTPAKKTLTPRQKAFIEKRLHEIFPDNIRTPDHPPYAWMIENAITGLNEEGGSSVESISDFISKEYKDLPFAHAALLHHHLKKLFDSADLVRSRNGYYSIGKSRTLHNRTSNPNPRFTNTRSLVPVLSSTPSSSTDPSSGSYESTSTCSSGECFIPEKGRKWTKRRKIKRKKSRKKRGIRILTKQNSGRGRGRGRGGARGRGRGRCCGRGLGSGSGRSIPEDMMVIVNNVDLTIGEEGVESRGLECHANRIDSKRIETLKEENDWPYNGNVGSVRAPAPQTGIRLGRPRNNRDMQLVEYGKNVEQEASEVGAMEENVEESGLQETNMKEGRNEQVELDKDNMLDDLIEEVFMELKGATERYNNPVLEIRDRSKGEKSLLIETQYIAQGMQCELNQPIYEISNSRTLQSKTYIHDVLTNDKHVEKDVIGGTHVVNESAGKNKLTLLLQKPRRQELNKTEKQVQHRGVEMEIIGQANVCEGDCPLIEEKDEKHVKNAFRIRERVNAENEFGLCDDELDKCEGRLGLSTPEKSVETNQCRKPRPRSSKIESNEVANRAETLAARHVLRKQRQSN